MTSLRNKIWCEKYRPKNFDDYIFNNQTQKTSLLKMMEDKNIPHLLFSGTQGSGKTSLARILISGLNLDNSDVLTINASDQNSVDVMRENIKQFAMSCPMGDFKVVLLEEMDFLSLSSQAVLRSLMEDLADSVRFVLTCNYLHKLMPAIISRCQHFIFESLNKDDIAERLVVILHEEKVKIDLDVVYQYIEKYSPDVRKIINEIQKSVLNGILSPLIQDSKSNTYKTNLLKLLEDDNWAEIRKMICNESSSDEIGDLYKFLYDNLHLTKKFSQSTKWEDGICVIADYLYKHSICTDSEINMAACLIKLGKI